MVRLILEGARTVAEAKTLVSNLTVYFPMDGMHFLIGDRTGASMVLEFSETDLSPRFMPQSATQPAIITNHSIYYYPDVQSFPTHDLTQSYNTFNRFTRLYDYLQASKYHKYTTDDGFYAMSLVYGFVNDASEGTADPLPLRTIWSTVMDTDALNMQVKFYTVDNDALQEPTFTDAYLFQLQP